MLQLQLALLLSLEPQILLLLLLLPLPKMGNPQELFAPRIISAALSPSAPVSLIAAQTAAAGAEADSQYESGGSNASHALIQALAPALLSSSAVGSLCCSTSDG